MNMASTTSGVQVMSNRQHSTDQADARTRDQQAVCHDDVRTVGRNEPSGKQRVCRERERSDGSPGEGSGRNDEGVQRPVRAQQEGTAHGEDDGDHLGGSRPSPVCQAHPDDDEDQAQVFQDGAGARVRGAGSPPCR